LIFSVLHILKTAEWPCGFDSRYPLQVFATPDAGFF
jgi:hypothetical protein